MVSPKAVLVINSQLGGFRVWLPVMLIPGENLLWSGLSLETLPQGLELYVHVSFIFLLLFCGDWATPLLCKKGDNFSKGN